MDYYRKMLALSACLPLFGTLAGAQTIDYGAGPFCFYEATADTAWSSTGSSRGTGWSQWVDNSEVFPGAGPNSADAKFYFQHNQTGIKVDGEYTVGYGYTNSDMASAKGEILVNMSGTTETGEDGVLNYVGDKNAAPEFKNAGFSYNTHHVAQVMLIGASNQKSRSMIYSGGTVNMLDSLGRIAVLGLYGQIDSKPENGCYTLSMTFRDGNTLNAANGLVLDGGRTEGSGTVQSFSSVFTFINTTNVGLNASTGKYDKDLVIGTNADCEKNNTSGTYAIQVVFGGEETETTLNAGGLNMNQNTSVVVKAGATLNLAGSSDSSATFGGIRMNAVAPNNVRSTNQARTYFELEKGGVVNTGFMRAGAGSDILINGEFNATSHFGAASIWLVNGNIVFGESAKLKSGYTTAGMFKFSGTATSNAQKGALDVSCSDQLGKKSLGLIDLLATTSDYASQNTKLILNTSDAFCYRGKTQKEVVIRFANSNAGYDVIVNANQNFDSLRFNGTNITANLVLDASVDEFNLTSLADGTLSGSNTLVIDGFREGVIKIDSWNDGDLLANIVSKNGDWVDFVYDNTTGYLSATHVVPEPATYAALFGLAAFALVLYRRR